VINRVLQLRAAGYNLAQISEKIIDECLEPEKGKRPPNDNITFILVDVAAYYKESIRSSAQSPRQLSLRAHSPC
jgi:hypothetical protein